MGTGKLNPARLRQIIAIAAGICVLFAVGAVAIVPRYYMSNSQLLALANQRLSRSEFSTAKNLADRILKNSPKSPEALMIAGQAAAGLLEHDVALQYYQQVEDDGSPDAIEALYECGRVSLEMGMATSAEQYLRRVLVYDPTHLGANTELALLLRVSVRNWELRRHFIELLRHERLDALTLAAGAVTETPWRDQNDDWLIESCKSANDVVAKVVHARELFKDNRYSESKEILRTIVAKHPDQVQAQVWLGSILVQTDSPSELVEWHRQLPAVADDHPGIWYVRGLWQKKRGENQHAARCFWEVLQRHPNHMGANYQLSQTLGVLERNEDAKLFAERSRQLANLEYLVREGKLRAIVESMESLGRHWEAIAWSRIALKDGTESDKAWANSCLVRLGKGVDSKTPLTIIAQNPALKIDLSEYPLPDWQSMKHGPDTKHLASPSGQRVSFVNSAPESGLIFAYKNGADPDHAYMFEFSGGGVAVLDFDLDGWPDIYLTQGCAWPPQMEQREDHDRLFRNLGNGKFADATEFSGLDNTRYGQGATVGDFNNDGFPDLYVANIGRNCFYQNNGDGTFTDITPQSRITETHWTLSCLIADLNGDSLPDIYDVNYLGGTDIFKRICRFKGQPIQCPPTDFPAVQDQVYVNQGDGSFRNETSSSGIVAPDGKGMGIISADFTNNGRLDLFVSNDTTANFFFVNETERGGALKFKEKALVCGLAFNNSGHADSCMGIAAADANNDGLVDLHVTNFDLESNNLYLQLSGLLFEDAAQQANLAASSYELMGWGTQFLDGDLDGFPDLVVANGQLDDYPHTRPRVNKMPTQYFSNVAGRQFQEVPATQLGPYFEQKYLGRAIARLDWNRDGLEDFCVTHVGAPTALLTNRTAAHGHYLTIVLKGVESSRDAIGTKVSVTAGGQSWTKQLIAGDGFQASNERQLVFGLGDEQNVDRVSVAWPSGQEQKFSSLEADHQYLLVEGAEQPHRTHRP